MLIVFQYCRLFEIVREYGSGTRSYRSPMDFSVRLADLRNVVHVCTYGDTLKSGSHGFARLQEDEGEEPLNVGKKKNQSLLSGPKTGTVSKYPQEVGEMTLRQRGKTLSPNPLVKGACGGHADVRSYREYARRHICAYEKKTRSMLQKSRWDYGRERRKEEVGICQEGAGPAQVTVHKEFRKYRGKSKKHLTNDQPKTGRLSRKKDTVAEQ